jgi:choline dehydrogenase-like flavoprotein
VFLEVLAPETGGAWSHTQLTGLNDQILDAIRSRLPRILHPLVGWLRHVIYFALSAGARPGHEASLLSSAIADNGIPQRVSVREPPSRRCPELVRAVRRAVWRHWRTLRMIPFPLGERLAEFFRGNRLGGWHFGGTLPMRAQPSREMECRPTGEVHGLAGVFVLDSSAFPTVPASTIALLTMAHGHRVARLWKSRLPSEVK